MKTNKALPFLTGLVRGAPAGSGAGGGKVPDGLVRLGAMAAKMGTRAASFVRETASDDALEIDLRFSSEFEVMRWFGIEILDHSAGGMDAEWLGSGRAPLLIQHDHSKQCGIVVAGSVQVRDGAGFCRVRFPKTDAGRDLYTEARDGFRPNVSVGYDVIDYQYEGARDGVDVYRVLRWRPYEVSFVSIGADPTAGTERAPEEAKGEVNVYGASEMSGKGPALLTGRSVRSVGGGDAPPPGNVPPVPAAPEGERSASHDDVVKAERERARKIADLGRSLNMQEAADKAVREGWTLAQFNGFVVESAARNNERNPLRPETELGLSDKEVRQFSLFRAIQAASPSGNWAQAGFEREVSDAVAKKLGTPSRGFYIPYDVMARGFRHMARAERAGEVATGGTGGNLVATNLDTASFVELLRPMTVAGRLGARMLSGLVGNVDIPKQISGSSVYWLNEGQAPTRGKPEYAHGSLRPRTIAAETAITRRMLVQTSMDVEDMVRLDMLQSIALEVDRCVMHGTGLLGQPLGIFNTPGVQVLELGENGGVISNDAVIDLETLVASVNADIGSLAYFTSPYGRGAMKKVPIFPNANVAVWDKKEVNGYQAVASNQVRSDFTKGTGTGLCGLGFGDFSSVVMGDWGVLDVQIDPNTDAAGGVIMRNFMDVDNMLRHQQAFAVIDDMKRTAA